MDKVYKVIGYEFKDSTLLDIAFSHSSYAHENKVSSNERLEFLGDSILGFVVSEFLYNNYNLPEGKLSKLKAQIVSASTLKDIIDNLGLFEYIKLGTSLINQHNTDFATIKADLFEALLGAVYLDGGIVEAKNFIYRFIELSTLVEQLLNNNIDYKTTLQELVQQTKDAKLSYKDCVSDDDNFAFKSEVYINDQYIACGYGKSKKEAEKQAANNSIQILNNKG